MNLNEKPLGQCYAFELRWIIQNDRAEGFRGSARRIAEAREELERRAESGDEKAVESLAKLRDECKHVLRSVESVSGRQWDGAEVTVDHLVCDKCGYDEWD
jgi:hypothetical protein